MDADKAIITICLYQEWKKTYPSWSHRQKSNKTVLQIIPCPKIQQFRYKGLSPWKTQTTKTYLKRNNQNSSMSILEIEFVVKHFSTKKAPSLNDFTG